jgi:hypothetical protein
MHGSVPGDKYWLNPNEPTKDAWYLLLFRVRETFSAEYWIFNQGNRDGRKYPVLYTINHLRRKHLDLPLPWYLIWFLHCGRQSRAVCVACTLQATCQCYKELQTPKSLSKTNNKNIVTVCCRMAKPTRVLIYFCLLIYWCSRNHK